MTDQSVDEKDSGKEAVNVFTHSSTGFPGAWPEEEIEELLSLWEEAVESLRPFVRQTNVVKKVLDDWTLKGLRVVKREDIVKQMNMLTTEYKTYLGLQKIGIPVVKGSCVPQMERILRRATARRRRRRQTSTASVQVSDDNGNRNENQSQPENTEDEANEGLNRVRRGRFQRQNLQRLIRTLLTQQRTLTEQLQNLYKKIDDSNTKIASLLGELVILQKLREKGDVYSTEKLAEHKLESVAEYKQESRDEQGSADVAPSREQDAYVDAKES